VEYLPAEHTLQTIACEELVYPAAQLSQDSCPAASWNFPAAQDEQSSRLLWSAALLVPADSALPSGQLMHVVSPSVFAYFPAPQTAHSA